MMPCTLPFASGAVASDVFFAGSNGTNLVSFGRSGADLREEAERNPGIGRTLVTESSLRVRVPVLSEHKTFMVAASSIAESRARSS